MGGVTGFALTWTTYGWSGRNAGAVVRPWFGSDSPAQLGGLEISLSIDVRLRAGNAAVFGCIFGLCRSVKKILAQHLVAAQEEQHQAVPGPGHRSQRAQWP